MAIFSVAAGLGLCLRCLGDGLESHQTSMGPFVWHEDEFCSCPLGQTMKRLIPERDHGDYNSTGVLMNHGEPEWKEKLERGRSEARKALA